MREARVQETYDHLVDVVIHASMPANTYLPMVDYFVAGVAADIAAR
ncbi:hypothetical protein OG496_31170 [Streptomyces sp. NBC_00988]|nr:hypothetical protein OG496_31170 [Streptomyces sp. NBC_00988]